ncbi:response regulator [Herminiimonas fonticola]|uniref:Tetratricopeptide repeat protein n=1 Tax=Herminiimonas fonticola TaxID=303380 RepID=A0A4V3BW86_9BURK|nr:response regulator [Herminiimonas fonticola]RBA24784.1 Response regulator receiver domain [Herminiimonas fonticola]TDN93898.1 tetratricopeptide repeat protein [Herminiimonas fonticola]
MQELAGLTALIIEPHAGMRASIHNMLSLGGMSKIEYANSSGTAIRPLKQKTFDLVICEYDLGEEQQDGQQLLEDLRHNKLIPLSTVFFMATAERTHGKVVSAAELALNDYVLKPFTADNLMERIAKAIEKRNALMPVYRLMELGNLGEAIEICQTGESAKAPYRVDFLRLRAEMHMTLGEVDAAEEIYTELLSKRSIAWAHLGLASTLFMQERYEEAEEKLHSLIETKGEFLDAYDWLAKTQEARGDLTAMQATLESAVARSPYALRRLRKLGKVALQNGDTETAHRVFQQVVSKAKFSEFREPEDHVQLVETALAKGEIKSVPAIIRDLAKSLSGLKKTAACRAIASAMFHRHNGDKEQASEELEVALLACKESIGLSNETKMALAKNCLENGLEQGVIEIMTSVVGNAPTPAAMSSAMRLLQEGGREDLLKRITQASKSEVVDLVSAGAEKARLGDFQGAVTLMSEAAEKLPHNPQVVFNAAVAALKCLDNIGWDMQLGEKARRYVADARRLDPRNPRLSLLTGMYRDILKKYKISGVDDIPTMPATKAEAKKEAVAK